MKKNWFIVLIILSIKLSAQVDVKDINIPSPNSYSFLKAKQYEISPYTGIPDINIPIFTLNEGDIILPLKLTYNSSGIKVSEVSSWAGLGWSLNTGCFLAEEVRGLPDINASTEYYGGNIGYLVESGILQYLDVYNLSWPPANSYFGMYYTDSWASQWLDINCVESYHIQEFEEIKTGQKDGEGDMFSVCTPDLNFNFFENTNDIYKTVPYSNVEINKTSLGWTIIDEKGLVYEFNKFESSQDENSRFTPIGWHITKITDPSGNYINFYYSNYFSHEYSLLQSKYAYVSSEGEWIPPTHGSNITPFHTALYSCKIDSIVTSSGNKVIFDSFFDRQDQEYEPRLSKVRIINLSGEKVREVHLESNYFQGNNPTTYSFEQQVFPNSNSTLRLKLSKLKINNEEYTFTYDENPLPSRYSIDQDLWGYFNAADNNFFIPSYFEILTDGRYLTIKGGNRTVNPLVNQANILKCIKYPTGGTTTFEYESNQVIDKLSNGIPASVILEDEYFEYTAHTGSSNISTNPVYSPVFHYSLGSTPMEFVMTGLLSPPPNWMTDVYICLVDATTNGVVYEFCSIDPAEPFTIPTLDAPPPGDYKLSFCCCPGLYLKASVSWKAPSIDISNGDELVNKIVGGLRIKSIKTDSKNFREEVRNFYYNKASDPSKSSGLIVNYPLHYRWYLTATYNRIPNCSINYTGKAKYRMLTSYPSNIIELNSGYPVGYSFVTEEFGINGLGGKIEYSFTDLTQYPDIHPDPLFDYPYVRNCSKGFQRGLLLRKDTYKYDSKLGGPVLIESISNEYATFDNWYNKEDRGVNLVVKPHVEVIEQNPYNCPPLNHYHESLLWRPYVNVSGWNNLMTSNRITYYDNGSALEEVTTYDYTDPLLYHNLLLTKKITNKSDGTQLYERFSYPIHFGALQAGNDYGILNLKSKHMVSTIIESSKYCRINSISLLKSSSFNEYDNTNGKIKKQYSVQTDKLLSDFQIAQTVNGTLYMDTRYSLEFTADSYNNKGKITQFHKKNGINNSIIYGYNESSIIGYATHSSNNEISYTSFENNELNGWSKYAENHFVNEPIYTGESAILVTNGFGPTKDLFIGVNANEHSGYQASVWVKGSKEAYLHIEANGWGVHERVEKGEKEGWQLLKVVLYKHRYESMIDSALKIRVYVGNNSSDPAYFDDIRFHPLDAQMTTYTSSPLIGVTSESDVNNKPVMYEYDEFGRLIHIRDFENYRRKMFEYHYKQ